MPIVDDVSDDPNEDFSVLLEIDSTIAIVRAGRKSATVTITDNDQCKYYLKNEIVFLSPIGSLFNSHT